MKTSRAAFKNALKFCRRNELRIKKTFLLSNFEQTKKQRFMEISEKNYFFNAQLTAPKNCFLMRNTLHRQNFKAFLKAAREVFITSKSSLLRGRPFLHQFKKVFPAISMQVSAVPVPSRDLSATVSSPFIKRNS